MLAINITIVHYPTIISIQIYNLVIMHLHKGKVDSSRNDQMIDYALFR